MHFGYFCLICKTVGDLNAEVFFTKCYPSGVLFGFACVYGLHIKYPCCTTCIFLCFFCPPRVCPGFFPLFFFSTLKRSQRSALKFWGCCSGTAPSLFWSCFAKAGGTREGDVGTERNEKTDFRMKWLGTFWCVIRYGFSGIWIGTRRPAELFVILFHVFLRISFTSLYFVIS